MYKIQHYTKHLWSFGVKRNETGAGGTKAAVDSDVWGKRLKAMMHQPLSPSPAVSVRVQFYSDFPEA